MILFLIFVIIIGTIVWRLLLAQKIKRNYEEAIAGTDFHADYISKTTFLREPMFAIDAQRRLFYIMSRNKNGGRTIFHASEVTNIAYQPSTKAPYELCITVTDLEEPNRYLYGGLEFIKLWYGRIQAVWNS